MGSVRLVVAVLLCALAVVRAQQSPAPPPLPPGITIKADAQPPTATVGDPIRIEISISMPQGFRAALPELKNQVGDFTLLDFQPWPATPPATPGRAEGPAVHRANVIVALYRTGPFEFPSLPIIVRDTSGKEFRAASPPVKVEIRSVLTGKDEKLKDLKKQAEIEDPARWLYRLGLVLLLLTLALLGWLLWRKKRRPALQRTELPGLDSFALAEVDLRDLIGRDLLERGFVKQFYVALSEIVKRVLEAGYRISTSEKTTSEILEALSQVTPASPSGTELTRAESFLSGCDLVKFAKYLPSKVENEAAVQAAFAILETCRKRGRAPEPQADAPAEVR